MAHALPNLPKIRSAFRAGRISYSKARAMTRVATPENEALLLNIAYHGTAAHVERAVRGYRFCRRRDALDKDRRRQQQRNLRWSVDADGSWVFRGRFTPEQGALIAKALEAGQEELFEDSEAPSREYGEEPDYPAGAKRADALERIAESFLAGSKKALNGGDRYLVEIHTDVSTLAGDGAGTRCDVEQRSEVSAETSRRLACDASLVHILERDGEPLNVGRKTRSIPPAIRRALKVRDAGCRFPGCTQTHYVDAHHIEHWSDGGETKLSNLILLCRKHHTMVHEVGYGVQKASGDELYFTNPQGRTIPGCPKTRLRGNASRLTDQNAESGVEITPATAIPRWTGEPMDTSAVIEAMLKADGEDVY